MAEAADSTSDMGFATDGTRRRAGYKEQGARGGSQRWTDVTDGPQRGAAVTVLMRHN